jgi:predicted phosphodiesterase
MRLAVLSDIHGNRPALDAVLQDVAQEGVDALVVLGDVVPGPDPLGVLESLATVAWPVYWVKGNADQEVIDAGRGSYAPTGDALWDGLTGWAADQLSAAQRDWMAGWPARVLLEVEGMGPVAFVHATPRSLTETLVVDSPPHLWQAALEPETAPAVVLGHTHMPFDRLVDRRRVVNPGSVGMPYGAAGACWALLGPAVTLRHSLYDPARASRRLIAAGAPGAETFVENYVRHHASDLEALKAFHGLR